MVYGSIKLDLKINRQARALTFYNGIQLSPMNAGGDWLNRRELNLSLTFLLRSLPLPSTTFNKYRVSSPHRLIIQQSTDIETEYRK